MWTTLVDTHVAVAIPAPAPEWVQLVQTGLVIGIPAAPPPTVEWVQLTQVNIVITVPAVIPPPEWVLLTQKEIGIKVVGVPEVPPEVPPVPPEEVKFPWEAVALLGGGAILVAASIKPKKKKA